MKNQKIKTEPKKVVKTSKEVAAKASSSKPVEITKKPTATKTIKTDISAKPATSKKQKVLFCISEAQPYCATGGLGEVGSSLPKAIAADYGDNIDIRVVLPLYKAVNEEVRKKFNFLGSMNISFAWHSEYCGVYELIEHGVIYYFIDNEKYFKRSQFYGYDDDGERFAFYSKACLDISKLTGFKPDLIHANDWHTALTVVYLKTVYSDTKDFAKIKSLFTIHNLNFQGIFPYTHMVDVFGIDYKYKNLLENSGNLNLVKAAIECCDRFNTVSPSYAEEIKTPQFAEGLEVCVNNNAHKLTGILNGIDCEFYNPAKDKEIFEKYGEKTLNKKVMNKRGIQKLFQMQIDDAIPMLLYNGRLTDQKGIDLIQTGIDTILSDRIQMVVMGNGEKRYENFFDYVEGKYQGKFKVVRYSNNLSKKLYAAADLVIMPSLFEPCGLSQMIASRYGVVPIVRETGGLKDSIRDFGCEGGGNGYTFKNYSVDDLLYSIRRGVIDFAKDGQDWINKMQTCIKKDFSWKNTVKEYIALYKKIK